MSDVVVRIKGLRKCYGRIVALDGMDLEVPRGALYGLLGPNGAGKSTTFGILCGWLQPTAGCAHVLGTPCDSLHRLRGRVAALPQDATFPRQVPVHSQLTHYGRLSGLDRKKARSEADRVLEQVDLEDVAPRKGYELSHGMLKRVGLAQALIGSPEVIFLDEPTAGLDPASSRHIKDVIASKATTATVIISSHNLAEIQEICSHGAILDRGHLVVDGTIDDLTRRSAEVEVEIREGATVPVDALRQAFGADHVDTQARFIRISFSNQDDVAWVIGKALRILLDHDVPVLGVRRGTTLETAFLEATSHAGAAS
ncbi:MAG: ABC transporter ATP-binding protein [Myxococcota bacterium]